MGTMIDVAADGAHYSAYRADPDGPARGAVLVIHEIWGLTPHILDVADRFAAAGYLAVAPDLMAVAGLDAALLAALREDRKNPAKAAEVQLRIREATAPLRAPEAAVRIQAAVAAVFGHLEATAEGSGRTAVVGFCFGGTYAYALAVAEPRLAGAVPFYGHADYTAEQLSGIKCPVLAFYGESDTALTDGLPQLIERMRNAEVDFRYTVFSGAGHAFFNDTNPATYRAEAAGIAWKETLEFLGEVLG